MLIGLTSTIFGWWPCVQRCSYDIAREAVLEWVESGLWSPERWFLEIGFQPMQLLGACMCPIVVLGLHRKRSVLKVSGV